MWEHIPSIIGEAAKSGLGILALAIILLSFVAMAFFRNSAASVKVRVFGTTFFGFAILVIAGFLAEHSQSMNRQTNQPGQQEPSFEAASLLNRAERFRSSGENDEARDAYIRAANLYKEFEDLEGEADVYSELGDFERNLGHIDKAREAYSEARTLFQAVGDRRNELDVQLSLDNLEDQVNQIDTVRETHVGGLPTNRTKLVSYVSSTSGLTLGKAEKAVNAVFDGVTKTLANGGEVRLVEFGTFSVASRRATTGRNPRTGATIQIPASRQPKFKAGKALKDAVNSPPEHQESGP